MAFPTIPTVAGGRVLYTLNTAGGSPKTFPNLSSLTKNAGDLLIAIIIEYDGNSTDAEFSSWGGGFTEFGDRAGTTTMAIGCAYKWSTGSETGTFTVATADTSANDSVLILISIPGAHDSIPPEASPMATSTAAPPAVASPFNPSGWGTEDTLWIAVGGSGETSTAGSYTGITGAPTNYTDYTDSGITADVIGGVEAALAFRQLNAASEAPGAWTGDTSNARGAALVIAVPPVIPVLKTASDSATGSDASAQYPVVTHARTDSGGVPTGGGSVGPTDSSSSAEEGSGIAWTNPGNVAANDGSPATVVLGVSQTSKVLHVENLGFSVPGGATITGVEVTTNDYDDQSSGATGNVYLRLNGTPAYSFESRTVIGGIGDSTVGSSADMWGESTSTLTPAVVNGSGFGAAFNIYNDSAGSVTFSLDALYQIKVYYTLSTGESAVTASDSAAKTASDSGSGSDASAQYPTAAIPTTEAPSGSDVSALATTLAVTDSGSGTDASALEVALATVDSGAGADSSVAPDAAIPVTETGAGSETSTLAAVLDAVVDSGTGTDAPGVVTVPVAAVDTGSGADASSLAVALAVVDSGTDTETATLDAVLPTVTDTGAGADASTLTVPVDLTDTGTGSDASALAAALAVTEAPTGADVSTLEAAFALTDTGSGTDASSLDQGVQSITASDTGSGADASALVAVLGVSDSAGTALLPGGSLYPGNEVYPDAGEVASWVLSPLATVDSGSGSDTSLLQTQIAVVESGTGADASTLVVAVATTDSGTGADVSALEAALSATETGSGADTSTLAVALATTDSGAGVDSVSAPDVALPTTESGTDTESSTLEAALAVVDSAAGTDSSSLDTGTTSVTASDSGSAAESIAALSLRVGDLATSTDRQYGAQITSYSEYPRKVTWVPAGNADWANAAPWATNDSFPYGTYYAEVVLPPSGVSDYLQFDDFPFWVPIWDPQSLADNYPNRNDIPYLATIVARCYVVEGSGVTVETRLKPPAGAEGNTLSAAVSNTASTYVTFGEALIVGPPRDGFPDVWAVPSITADPTLLDHTNFGFEIRAVNSSTASRTLRLEYVQTSVIVESAFREASNVGLAVSDSGSGTEAAGSVGQAFSVVDSGSASDASSVTVPVSASDSGVGSETSSVASVLPGVTESATGTDTATVQVALAVIESAVGNESVGGFGIAVSDSGVGSFALGDRIFGVAFTALGVDIADADWNLLAQGEGSLELVLHGGGTETLTALTEGSQTLTPAGTDTQTLTGSAEDSSLTLTPIDWEPQ